MVSIGKVIATNKSPSLEDIDIILENDLDFKVEGGQFVSIHDSDERIVLGIITGIRRHNVYYEIHQSSVQTAVSRDFESIFPVDEWNVILAEIHPLGEVYSDQKRVERLKYPVSPGSRVSIASRHLVSLLLGLKKEGINLGTLKQNDVDVTVDLSRLVRKHLAILAISGAGKSYATSVLLEEFHKQEHLAVLLIDPHGEYKSVITNWSEGSNTEIVDGSFVSIGISQLSAWEIAEFIPEISPVQIRVLEKVIQTIQKRTPIYGLQDLIKIIESSEEINIRTKEALVGWLHQLIKTYLFSSHTSPDFSGLIKPGKIVVLDLGGITSIRSRQIIALHFLKNLYRLRMKNKIPPLVFVIEEAHQFCSESTRSISKRIIESIAREGRKFYASLCLISQRPVNMSVTALSQCNSNLILRIRNPYDLDFIGKTSESIDRSALNMIPSLNVGEALLVGEAINFPTFFKIRQRKFDSIDPQLDFSTMAKKFSLNWKDPPIK